MQPLLPMKRIQLYVKNKHYTKHVSMNFCHSYKINRRILSVMKIIYLSVFRPYVRTSVVRHPKL